MKKIVFFQIGPGIGPITNNNFRFARSLLPKGFIVDLLGTDVDKKVYEASPDGMLVSSLGAKKFIKAFKPLLRYLRKEKPNVLLASGPTTHVMACIAKRVTGYPDILVLRIHAHTTSLLSDRSWLNRKILLMLMRLTHQWADFKVSASRGAADDWAYNLGVAPDNIRVMYNPAIGEDVLEKSKQEISHPWFLDDSIPVIVTVARLAPEKSLDVLLKAFSIVKSKRPVRLVILGEGPLREILSDLAEKLGISGSVDFYGWVNNPYAFLSRANLFVLTSWYEGFANVIAEALACGCPVVSTDAPSGPSEILEGGKYGRLVPVGDVDAVANAIELSLLNPSDPKELKERGMRFHVDKVISEADDFFNLR